jgi:ribose 5-phosphate isomerase B
MKIAIGADHRGFKHKEYIRSMMQDYMWLDVGAYDEERSDYPLFAQRVCEAMRGAHDVDFGILICATGVGMAVAANRYAKIYAALAWNIEVAVLSRQHDASNILVLPSDYVLEQEAVVMIQAWLATAVSGERYQERIAMIDELP